MSKHFSENVNLEYSQTGPFMLLQGGGTLKCVIIQGGGTCVILQGGEMLIRWSLNKMCHVKAF